MLPDKSTRCHRTGFTKTCFKCVTEYGCRLWKEVTLEFHPETGQHNYKTYDCVDSLNDLYAKDMLRRQVQTTATVDALRKEVHDGNDVALVGTLARLNNRIDEVQSVSQLPPQTLIGN